MAKGSADLLDYRHPDLLDMKFSKNTSNTDWTQLKFYDLMFTLMLNRKIRKTLTFSPLHNEPFEEHVNTREDIKEFVGEIEKVVTCIRNDEFEATAAGSNECFNCVVRDTCEHGGYYKAADTAEVKIDDGQKKMEL